MELLIQSVFYSIGKFSYIPQVWIYEIRKEIFWPDFYHNLH
jgi:hypothetical protein